MKMNIKLERVAKIDVVTPDIRSVMAWAGFSEGSRGCW